MTGTAVKIEETVPAFEASELIEYGKIEEITQAGKNSGTIDGPAYS